MKIVKRTPQRNQDVQFRPVNNAFDELLFPTVWNDFFNMGLTQKSLFADVWEDSDNVYIKMAMPGVNKDNIQIEITGDTVSIRGHAKEEEKQGKEGENKYYFRSLERDFEQMFNLPTLVDSDKSTAEYKDGILMLKLPKSEQVKPKQIAVK